MTTVDFGIFYKAAQALLSGVSPYTVSGFFNPVWALIPFLPLTLLSFDMARMVYPVISLLGILIALMRFRIKPLIIAALVLLSPLVWLNLVYANVDWCVLLGATLPAPFGIWLVMMKPQLAIGIVLFWLLRRETRRIIVFAPVTMALVLNYALLGLPDFSASKSLGVAAADVFPWGLPIAVLLMRGAIQQMSMFLAVPVSVFASPYVSSTSWLLVAPLARSWRWLLVVLVVTWIAFVIWRQSI